MIRPITCLCALAACGAGLYLYQSKHQVQLLDRRIERAAHSIDVTREQTKVLRTEWTLANDPDRLQQLATQFLTLKPIVPTQFTSMADLDSRLPAPRAPDPTPPPPAAPMAAVGTPAGAVAGPPNPTPLVAVAEPAKAIELPQPPAVPVAVKPATVVAIAAPPAAERKPIAVPAATPGAPRPAPRPVVTAVTPSPVVTASLVRQAPPRVVTQAVAPQVVAQPVPMPVSAAPFSGSLLGMAHHTPLPPALPAGLGVSNGN